MDIVQMIQAYGFPIAACAVMAWYVKYITDDNNARLDKLNADHKEETAKITEALANNTLALQHLTDMIAYGEGADRVEERRSN